MERFNIANGTFSNFLNDGFTKLQSEFAPVDTTGIHETVECIFSKGNNRWTHLFLLVKGLVAKDILECNLKHIAYREAANLIGIAGLEYLANMEFFQETRYFWRKMFTKDMILWYNVHGISPPFMLWLLSLSLYKTERAYAIFLGNGISRIIWQFHNCEVWER